jgi:carbamoyl-phosphate synthase small subunit
LRAAVFARFHHRPESVEVASLEPAVLVLADGSVFRGRSIGAPGMAVGEVVFNTAITGYQEILTDPSYCQQIVTLTYPHVGNTGINIEDEEATRIHAAGLVVRDVPAQPSNWRSQRPLQDYLKAAGVVGISDIDTRRLTRLLREKGAQNGCLMAGAIDEGRALAEARKFPGLAGMDLAKVVSAKEPYEWREGSWALGSGFQTHAAPRVHVVAYDYGVKRNILRLLADRGARITVLPAKTSAKEALKLKPDGIFLSNGPGDPEPCDYAIDAIREILDSSKLPVFGICLGHQLMGLASGAKTMKMKFGHHGANHPVKDLDSGRVAITSQNHGFAVDPATLPANLRATHVSLFDGSLQGLARTDRPAFCFQGHPEASPGPHDIGYLFDRFAKLMDDYRAERGSQASPVTPSLISRNA